MKYYLFGIHASLSALKNEKRKIYSIHISPIVFKKYKNEIENRKIPYYIENEKFFNKISSSTQHFVLLVAPIAQYDISEKLLNEKQILILENLQDSGNVGAIIRSAYAFGISFIILPTRDSAKENGQMAKNAVGYLEKVNLIYVNSISSTITKLKQNYFWIIGLSSHAKDKISYEKHVNSKLCFILGSEDKGMRKTIQDSCDFLYYIPSQTESLNVASTCAIVLYEFAK